MATSEQLLKIIIRAIDQASGPMSQVAQTTRQVGQTMTAAGTALTAGLTLPIVAAGAAGVKMAIDLDESMRNIQSVGRQTDGELADLSKTFVQMSTDATRTRDSALGLSEAFYDIQGSGFAGDEAMQVLRASTKAASAGLTDTAIAAKGVTAVLNSYGESADQAEHNSDLMFRTVDRGVGTFEELAGSVNNVTGSAANMGVGFDEVSAALATMSKQGATFSEASVQLNQVLSSLLNPNRDLEKAIKQTGYSTGYALLQAEGLNGTLEALSATVDGDTAALAGLFGNVRAGRAVFALTGEGAQIFADDLAAMADVAGATGESFAIQMQSFAAQWDVFKNTLNAFLITAGQQFIPVLTEFLQALTPIVAGLANAPPIVTKLILVFAGLLAVIGPILLVLGQIVTAVSGIMTIAGTAGISFAGLGTAVVGASGALVGLLAVALPVLAILALLAAGILIVITHLDLFKGLLELTGIILGKMVEAYAERLRNLGTITGVLFQAIGQKIQTQVQQWGQNIRTGFNAIVQGMAAIGQHLMNALVQGIVQKTQALVTALVNAARQAIQGVRQVLQMHSPSRVTAELGQNMVAGVIQGIEQMNITPAFQAALTPGGAGIAVGGAGGAFSGATFNIYASSYAEGQAAGRGLLAELGRQSRQKYGVRGRGL